MSSIFFNFFKTGLPSGNPVYILELFLVKSLEVVLFYEALKLLAACGARKLLGIDRAVKADDFSARGALYLKIIVFVAAVAITIAVTVAIAVAIVLIAKNLFNVAEILVDLLDILAKLNNLVLKLLDSNSHIGNKIGKSGNNLALLGCGIQFHSVAKALNVRCSFVKCHFHNSSPPIKIIKN